MSKKDLLSQCREALGDATLTNLDLLNLIGEMQKELEHDRICGCLLYTSFRYGHYQASRQQPPTNDFETTGTSVSYTHLLRVHLP